MMRSSHHALGGLSTGSVLYLAAQFPPAFTGVAMLLLVMWSAVGPAQPLDRLHSRWRAIALRPDRVVLIVAAIGAVVLVQSMVLPNDLKPFTAAHLIAYSIVALARRDWAPDWPAATFVRAVSVVNAALLLSFFLPGLTEVFWFEFVGQYRYRSFYLEPSIAAIIAVLNLVVLWHSGGGGRREFPYIVCNLLCLALTFSGSGLLLLGVVLIASIRRSNATVGWRYGLLVVPAVIAWTSSESGGAAIQELIVGRAAGILSLEYDNSVHLRAIAPMLFVAELLDGGLHTWLGAGIGGIESYVLQHARDMWFMVDFAGDTVAEINNGYVVVIALFGVPLGVVFILLWLTVLVRARVPAALKAYVILYPLVSGFVIHPLFWLLVVMIGSRSRTSPAQRHSTPCASAS